MPEAVEYGSAYAKTCTFLRNIENSAGIASLEYAHDGAETYYKTDKNEQKTIPNEKLGLSSNLEKGQRHLN